MRYLLTIILALVAFVGVAQTRLEIVAGKNYDMERKEWKQAVELNQLPRLKQGGLREKVNRH